jgi:adenosine kinase
MSALICGSLAYDTIMVFPERFRDHILADQVHILNVSFLVPQMRREFGGCAGNIAYNLKLLGGDPLPMATVGEDFEMYGNRFEQLEISLKHVLQIDGEFTAQAFITTDLDDNQITAFHPGAMQSSCLNSVADAEGIRVGLVGPDSKEAMYQHSDEFKAQGIPHIFDPGQALPLFNGDEFKHFIDNADWVIVNSYEAKMLQERTGYTPEEIAAHVDAYIVTSGGEGSTIHTELKNETVKAVRVNDVVDPTGCGDAYRGGMLYGLLNDMDLPTCCRLGSLMGAIKVTSQGPQNHSFTMDEFRDRFRENYSYNF